MVQSVNENHLTMFNDLAVLSDSETSSSTVHASSVNMFKNKIDKYLAKAGYT